MLKNCAKIECEEELMYINKIHIQNYRNFNDFTMQFHEGLNVIVGPNNSGKTGLLYAINLLGNPSDVSVDDFNKNNIYDISVKNNKTNHDYYNCYNVNNIAMEVISNCT